MAISVKNWPKMVKNVDFYSLKIQSLGVSERRPGPIFLKTEYVIDLYGPYCGSPPTIRKWYREFFTGSKTSFSGGSDHSKNREKWPFWAKMAQNGDDRP